MIQVNLFVYMLEMLLTLQMQFFITEFLKLANDS